MAVGRPRVAIATGDPGGIGPEISIKAAHDVNVLALCRPARFEHRLKHEKKLD